MLAGKIKAVVYRWLPDSWILWCGSNNKPVIYLSFDDGPHDTYTNSLLRILNEHDVKASFFVTGDHVNVNKNLLNEIEESGHDIYNHSYSHWEFEKYSTKEKILDLEKLDRLIITDKYKKNIPFRPPRGKLNLALFLRLVISNRQIIYWSYDSMDYKQDSVDFLLNRFEKKPIRNGDIILFHDDNPFTIAALPQLIKIWIDKGFEIHPISKLIN